MQYQVVTRNPDGSGQVEVTLFDGSKFGQFYTSAPVNDDQAFDAFIQQLAVATTQRLADQATRSQAVVTATKAAVTTPALGAFPVVAVAAQTTALEKAAVGAVK